jgi:hypothetical protein
VQACVLLGAFSIVEGEAAPEAVYYSVACRIAMLLDLANAPAATRLEQEVNRRGMHVVSDFARRHDQLCAVANYL